MEVSQEMKNLGDYIWEIWDSNWRPGDLVQQTRIKYVAKHKYCNNLKECLIIKAFLYWRAVIQLNSNVPWNHCLLVPVVQRLRIVLWTSR